MEEEIAWLMNSLSNIPSPLEPLHPSDLILISTKKHQIQLINSSLTHQYCLILFQLHKIPPLQKISSGSTPQGNRKSFKQSYETIEQAQLCLHIFIFLLNQCWGYSAPIEIDDHKRFHHSMEQYLQVHLHSDHRPIDFMIQVMYAFLYPNTPQSFLAVPIDSDEEFEQAAKALSAISPLEVSAKRDSMISLPTSLPASTKDTSQLAHQILSVLSANQSMKALTLAKKLNLSKTEVNQCLYQVLQNQVIHNSDNTWSVSGGLLSLPTPPQRKRAGEDLPISSSQSPLQNQIETYLLNNSPCNAQTLRRALSIQRTKSVNQTLYELLRKGRVSKSSDQPPLWSIPSS